MAEVFMICKYYAEVVAILTSWIEEYPNSPNVDLVYSMLNNVYIKLEDWDNALSTAFKLLAMQPEDGKFYYGLISKIYNKQGELGLAKKYAEFAENT